MEAGSHCREQSPDKQSEWAEQVAFWLSFCLQTSRSQKESDEHSFDSMQWAPFLFLGKHRSSKTSQYWERAQFWSELHSLRRAE